MAKIEMLQKGTKVTWLAPKPEGVVVDVALVNAELEYLVEFTAADGEKHQRWFKANEVSEAIPERARL